MKNALPVDENGRTFLTEDLIGKYINQYFYSDVSPVGKIVGIHSKQIALVREVRASENLTKMNFIEGGFSAHCDNQNEQSYEFEEVGEPFKVRLSESSMKNNHFGIADKPRKFYDFNF